MNRNDLKLVIVLFIITIPFLLIFRLSENNNNKKAIVYYEDEIVLKIDLSQNNEYQVEGYNGVVNIVVKDSKIKVENENSLLHLCSKQGYISASYETIVCLPNKITITIEDAHDNLDTIVK